MKIALLQMPVSSDPEKNIATAAAYTARAAREGARLAVLPEMFCCPYRMEAFAACAEEKGGRLYQALSRMARGNGITLVGGSFPLREGGKLYNASFVFDPMGQEAACHRKVHLFDVDLPGGPCFRESDLFTPGDQATVFHAEGMTFGLAICFDLRFPPLFDAMVRKGAGAVLLPAVFSLATGRLHWGTLLKARAVDHQVYVAGAAPAREPAAPTVYAHSLVCDPMGRVTARAGARPSILYATLDPEEPSRVRRQLPLLTARREDVYTQSPSL